MLLNIIFVYIVIMYLKISTIIICIVLSLILVSGTFLILANQIVNAAKHLHTSKSNSVDSSGSSSLSSVIMKSINRALNKMNIDQGGSSDSVPLPPTVSDPSLVSSVPKGNSDSGGSNGNEVDNNNNIPQTDKAIIINFDDGWKSQFTLAKPILDSFGFKATFFVVCNYVEKGASSRMDWQDISQLQNEGYDIESHTMDHKDLTTLSLDQVNYEVGQSKQCLADHGIDSSVFAYPFASGANDPSVVDIVSKYYDMARTGGSKIELLHPADRYSISAINHASKIQQQQPQQVSLNDNPTSLSSSSSSSSLDNFIQIVNSESKYNRNGIVNAIPIIVYHQIGSEGGGGIDNGGEGQGTDVNLFAQEMKYLHDNGFTVLTMANLRYNQNDNSLYIPGITAGAPSG
jgi:peptidoglycan/xylan/chitin deacetylase (PgdA/CDA1 family)